MADPATLTPGKERLLDAAEAVMDERGVDVSSREIQIASGHKNPSAILYHFGDRESLVRAMFDRRSTDIDAERVALVDHLEAEGRTDDPRAITDALVAPMCTRLETPEGRRFWRVTHLLMHHPSYRVQLDEVLSMTPGIIRCRLLLAGTPFASTLPPPILVERAVQIVGLIARSLAEQARLLDLDDPPRPVLGVDAFKANLIDTAVAVLDAPSTAEIP